jgi:hypothetical protein
MKWIKGKPVVFSVVVLAGIFALISSAQGQSGFLGGLMTYDPSNKWVLVTDHTNTWHAPMAFHNAAAPNTSITEFVVNTDDQFEIQTFNQSRLAALLDLDTNGGAALYGAAGGGIGVEGTTGDTCIPTSPTVACAPTALRVGANGILTQYRGQQLDGNGLSTILFHADSTLSGTFGPYTIFTTNASGYASSGMYRLSGYLTALNTVPASTMQFIAGYTDETGAQIQSTGAAVPFDVTGRNVSFSFFFHAEAGTPITIITNTPIPQNYTIHLRLEAL